MIKGKHTRIAGGAKFWSGNTAMVGGLISKPVIINQQNFVSSPSLPIWLTLTRLSSATYFDSSMNLQTASNDVARFDYWDSSGIKVRGLLLEKQATNYSKTNNFNSWTVNNVTRTTTADVYSGITGINLANSRDNNTLDRLNGVSDLIFSSTNNVLAVSAIFKSIDNVFMLGVNCSTTFTGFGSSFTTPVALFGSTFYLNSKSRKLRDTYYSVSGNLDIRTSGMSGSATVAPIIGPGGTTIGKNVNAYACNMELSTYSSSYILTSGTAVTRSQDSLQLNVANYTGSIKLTYQRQDTDATESAWIDLTSATNPILTNSVAVGIWLQNIAVYNRTLTAQEKANA